MFSYPFPCLFYPLDRPFGLVHPCFISNSLSQNVLVFIFKGPVTVCKRTLCFSQGPHTTDFSRHYIWTTASDVLSRHWQLVHDFISNFFVNRCYFCSLVLKLMISCLILELILYRVTNHDRFLAHSTLILEIQFKDHFDGWANSACIYLSFREKSSERLKI